MMYFTVHLRQRDAIGTLEHPVGVEATGYLATGPDTSPNVSRTTSGTKPGRMPKGVGKVQQVQSSKLGSRTTCKNL
jgi:hypothetical protein